MITKKLQNKHLHREVTERDDEEIRKISHNNNIPYILAKHLYFEKQSMV